MDFIPQILLEDAKSINEMTGKKSSLPKARGSVQKTFNTIKTVEKSLVEEVSEEEFPENAKGGNVALRAFSPTHYKMEVSPEVKYDPNINPYSGADRSSILVGQEERKFTRTSAAPPQPIDESKILITRRQVIKLKETMNELIKSFNIADDQQYSSEMDIFITTIREESKIYESVFMEIIKQVSVQMIERGEILQEIRNRYMSMFRKIPDRIVGMHNELVAHRKLNRRLVEELQRVQENIAGFAGEVDSLRKNYEPNLDADAKFETSKYSIEDECDNFYKSQISRLEARLEQCETEKNLWILATKNLSMRISDNYGMKDLQSLFKCEESRVRTTNHIVSLIRLSNSEDHKQLEKCIKSWQDEAGSLSMEIIELDRSHEHSLSSLKKEVVKMRNFLTVNKPENEIEEGHALLKDFTDFDLNFLRNNFKIWVKQLSEVFARYSKNTEESYRIRLSKCKNVTKIWAESGHSILKRHEKCTSKEEYQKSRDELRQMLVGINEWFAKLESVINGDDGISNNLLILKTEVEDTCFTIQRLEKLGNAKREQIVKSINEWEATIEFLIAKFSNTKSNNQEAMSSRILKWIEAISDRMNRDHTTRSKVTMKWHIDLIDWIVNVLLPGQTENYSLTVYQDSLFKRIFAYNSTLILDSSDLEMLSDDKRDLKKLLSDLVQNLQFLTGKLLKNDIASLIPQVTKKEYVLSKADRIY